MSAGLSVEMPADNEDLEAVYGWLIEVQWPQLVVLCVMAGRSRADAEDIVGEAFARLYQRHSAVQAPAPYLRQVVVRLLTRGSRERPCPDVGAAELSVLPGVDEVEGNELIEQALALLPGRRRLVFALHLAGHPTGEIARLLDMQHATVRSHLRHARSTLKAWWIKERGQRR